MQDHRELDRTTTTSPCVRLRMNRNHTARCVKERAVAKAEMVVVVVPGGVSGSLSLWLSESMRGGVAI